VSRRPAESAQARFWPASEWWVALPPERAAADLVAAFEAERFHRVEGSAPVLLEYGNAVVGGVLGAVATKGLFGRVSTHGWVVAEPAPAEAPWGSALRITVPVDGGGLTGEAYRAALARLVQGWEAAGVAVARGDLETAYDVPDSAGYPPTFRR
jgi:hypothetical protein